MTHDHTNKNMNYNRSFLIGILLNIIFVCFEAGFGIVSGSLALIVDAGHNLSDVASLFLAWGAAFLAKKKATEKRTYGYRRITVLASLSSAILLLFALGGIAWEAIGRLYDPKPVNGITVIIVASIGVIINTITALLFLKGQKSDLNIRGAFLHMAADAGVSFGVVIAGIIITTTGWLLVDPLISLVVVAIIFIGTWSLLRDSINLSLDAVPEGIDMGGIKSYLKSLEDVLQVHDLHVWAISTTEVALSVHLIVSGNILQGNFLSNLQKQLHDYFDIDHCTIQVERLDGEICILNKDECV